MTDYRIELQAFVDAAASFTEPALGHHKAWAEAVARARVALSAPKSSTNSVCPITPPPELVKQWVTETWHEGTTVLVAASDAHIATQAAQWGSDQELEACCEWLDQNTGRWDLLAKLRAARRFKSPNKKQRGLTALEATNLKKDDPLLYQEILNAIEALPND